MEISKYLCKCCLKFNFTCLYSVLDYYLEMYFSKCLLKHNIGEASTKVNYLYKCNLKSKVGCGLRLREDNY